MFLAFSPILNKITTFFLTFMSRCSIVVEYYLIIKAHYWINKRFFLCIYKSSYLNIVLICSILILWWKSRRTFFSLYFYFLLTWSLFCHSRWCITHKTHAFMPTTPAEKCTFWSFKNSFKLGRNGFTWVVSNIYHLVIAALIEIVEQKYKWKQ